MFDEYWRIWNNDAQRQIDADIEKYRKVMDSDTIELMDSDSRLLLAQLLKAGITGDALKDKRQQESYPVIRQFEKWMYETAGRTSQNSRIGKAISYTLPLLPRLSRYVNDGRFCIDNNLVENAIRPLALGRKNFLFCGNHDAAVRAAIVYSLVDTCKSRGVDPRAWIEDVLLRIPGNENNREALRELLPDKWAKKSN